MYRLSEYMADEQEVKQLQEKVQFARRFLVYKNKQQI
jgi:hypothetical protein